MRVYYIRYSEKPFVSALCDVIHDGWLCTVHLLCNSRRKFHQLAAGQLLSEQPVRYRKAGGTARPSRTKSQLPGHSPPARRAPALGQPSSLLICQDTNQMRLTVRASTTSLCPLCDSGSSVLCVHNSTMVNLHKPVTP
jgi:hypothetical protein